jgi:isopenicillin N synthase-like dioxygenase
VTLTLTDVFAPALGLADGWFRPFVGRSTTTMRVNNYERRADDGDPLAGQQRMGAHTDYGVVTPPAGTRPVRRRSVAFFLDADWDATIECVPTCTDATNPPKYPPVVAGAHLMAKLLGPRTLRPSEAMDTAGDRAR